MDERIFAGPLNEEKVIASIQRETGWMPREDCEIVAEKILRHGGLDDVEAYFMDRMGTYFSIKVKRATDECFVFAVNSEKRWDLLHETNYSIIRTQGLTD